MLRDLSKADQAQQQIHADVLVIGGGIAGLVLATRLAKRGVRTVVLESGSECEAPQPHPLNTVTQLGSSHYPAENGRNRGLGGTSVRWGGAMLPFLTCDMGPHTAGWGIDWPVSFEVLSEFFIDIEHLFRLPPGPFEMDGQTNRSVRSGEKEPPFILRSAKWPAFKNRNMTRLLHNEIHKSQLEIWVNATAIHLRLNESGRVSTVVAVSPSGHVLSADAQIVVIAAGAIESTRLLLLLDEKHDSRIFHPHGLLGRYFFDHLSAPAAIVHPANRPELNMAFGMRFEGTGMRDIRIEPAPSLRRSWSLPGAFAHLAIRSDARSGFAALRSINRDLQSRSSPNWQSFHALWRDLPWVLEAISWRLAKRCLLAPSDAQFELMLVIEQKPDSDNTITLDEHHHDRHKNPLARIKWRVSTRDCETFGTFQSLLMAHWREHFSGLGSLRPTPVSEWRERLLNDSAIYHPGGTTRMGRDQGTGVVNCDLKTFQIENLFVVSTSAFPSGGGANPTFMLLAFAMRAAERIARDLHRATTAGCLAYGIGYPFAEVSVKCFL